MKSLILWTKSRNMQQHGASMTIIVKPANLSGKQRPDRISFVTRFRRAPKKLLLSLHLPNSSNQAIHLGQQYSSCYPQSQEHSNCKKKVPPWLIPHKTIKYKKKYFKNLLPPPTVPRPRPAYFIHHGTSSLATTSWPGRCISWPIFSVNDWNKRYKIWWKE